MRFEDLIHPITPREFATCYLGRAPLFGSWDDAIFTPSIDWDRFSSAVRRIRLYQGQQRVSLFHRGETVDPSRFTVAGERARGVKLDTGPISRLLAEGATMVVDGADELFQEIALFADDVDVEVVSKSRVKLVASWRDSKTTAVSCDACDVVALHLQGVTDWTIYEPTRFGGTSPEGQLPYRSELRGAGSYLYLPRGWQYCARSTAGLNLQLIAQFVQPTGKDLFRWLIDELKCNAALRMDLPRLGSLDSEVRHSDALGVLLTSALTPDIVAKFSRHWQSQLATPNHLHLQWATDAPGYTLGPAHSVRLSAARRVSFTFASTSVDAATVIIGDRRWKCKASLIPALELLTNSRDCALSDLYAAIDSHDRKDLKHLLLGLCETGVVLSMLSEDTSST